MSPWTTLWDRNYFASMWPLLGAVMQNDFARGGVTGVGLIAAWLGVRELSGAFVARWSKTK